MKGHGSGSYNVLLNNCQHFVDRLIERIGIQDKEREMQAISMQAIMEDMMQQYMAGASNPHASPVQSLPPYIAPPIPFEGPSPPASIHMDRSPFGGPPDPSPFALPPGASPLALPPNPSPFRPPPNASPFASPQPIPDPFDLPLQFVPAGPPMYSAPTGPRIPSPYPGPPMAGPSPPMFASPQNPIVFAPPQSGFGPFGPYYPGSSGPFR